LGLYDWYFIVKFQLFQLRIIIEQFRIVLIVIVIKFELGEKMDIPITEIGVGGAVALIIVREAFRFAKDMKSPNSNDAIKRKEFEEHKRDVVYKDNCALVTEFNNERFNRIDRKLEKIETLIKNGGK